MKTVKSALLGSKSVIDQNSDVLLFELKELLKEHRELIINRLASDLPTYLDYKFNARPDHELLMVAMSKLIELKNSKVNLSHYDHVVQHVMTMAVTHLTNEPFYREIDEYLAPYIITSQLKVA